MTFKPEVYENKKVEEKEKNILVFGAHSDDQVFGAGGTIPKMYSKGYNIITIIMSQGEKSHPWLEEKNLIKIRIQESLKAAEILNIKKTIFLNLKEEKILKEFEENSSFQDFMITLFERYKPEKIFLHNDEDTHPSHKQVFEVVRQGYWLYKEKNKNTKKIDFLSYDVWTITNFKKDNVWVYVDITNTFKKKIQALKVFKSQKLALWTLWFSVYFKAIYYGLISNFKYSERFVKKKFD